MATLVMQFQVDDELKKQAAAAKRNGTSNMTLEKLNAEITAAGAERAK